MDISIDAPIAAEFERDVLAQIPLTRAMQLRVQSYNGDSLALAAPLAPNVNDKGCAFGGSLAGLMTLAGWGLIVLKLRSLGQDCDVFVQDSTIRYVEPVWDDLIAVARLAEGESWEAFRAMLASRGRARLGVVCDTAPAGARSAVTFQARFVAIARAAD